MVEAGVQAGYPRTDDLNGYQQEGFGPMDRTVTPKGRRSSTARGYLDMAKGRPNLTILTHATTNKILFNQKQAIGVEYIIGADQNNLQRALVKREVLLCRRNCVSANFTAFRCRSKYLLKINGH